jgi:hypothetical protein
MILYAGFYAIYFPLPIYVTEGKDAPPNFCKQQTYVSANFSSIQDQGLKDHHPYILFIELRTSRYTIKKMNGEFN